TAAPGEPGASGVAREPGGGSGAPEGGATKSAVQGGRRRPPRGKRAADAISAPRARGTLRTAAGKARGGRHLSPPSKGDAADRRGKSARRTPSQPCTSSRTPSSDRLNAS